MSAARHAHVSSNPLGRGRNGRCGILTSDCLDLSLRTAACRLLAYQALQQVYMTMSSTLHLPTKATKSRGCTALGPVSVEPSVSHVVLYSFELQAGALIHEKLACGG